MNADTALQLLHTLQKMDAKCGVNYASIINTVANSRICIWKESLWQISDCGFETVDVSAEYVAPFFYFFVLDTPVYVPLSVRSYLNEVLTEKGYDEMDDFFVHWLFIAFSSDKQTDRCLQISFGLAPIQKGFVHAVCGIDGYVPFKVENGKAVFECEGDATLFKWIETKLRFMDEPFIETQPEQLPRNYRRRLEREGKRLPDIRTVALRRRENKEAESTGEGIGREYSCQWLVGGHWRNQYHPSDKSRKPRFIAPYVKGPSDKPLRVRPTVYRVAR